MVPLGVESVYASVVLVDEPDLYAEVVLSIAVTGVWVCNVRSKREPARDLAS